MVLHVYKIVFLVILVICILVLIGLFANKKDHWTALTNIKSTLNDSIMGHKIFKVPPSFTKLQSSTSQLSDVKQSNSNESSKTFLEQHIDKLNDVISKTKFTIDSVNIVQVPSFFNANERWPGCLPRPLYQGTCGSCWGFASVTCLSSRFYIETCGNSNCGNYPQINNGSIDDVFNNINSDYNFNKVYLKSIADYIDSNDDGYITKTEWMNIASSLQKKLLNFSKTSNGMSVNPREKHYIAQILLFMLDFQSLGSLDIKNTYLVKQRSSKTYDIWLRELSLQRKNTKLSIKELQDYWKKQPLNLSAEKLITCCANCYKIDFDNKNTNNPVCMGGSLEDAWILLRDTGTTATLCIGYNLDNYKEGDHLSSCRELQGPFYSFCSGYRFDEKVDPKLNQKVDNLEKSNVYPVAIPHETDLPWIDPQLFRFRSKNSYTISGGMVEIQREILQRGPVNSGFYIYDDFQNKFGGMGFGGQLYDGIKPLGSDSRCLIYMRDPSLSSKPTGGHAITIVGWGTFTFVFNSKEYNIPYWTCLNSWGVEWGHSGFPKYENRNGVPRELKGGGYFWIVRGINNCGIEENVVCGQPNIENLSYPGIIDKYGWGADPPSLTSKNINFLEPLDTGSISVNNKKLEILPAKEGGGTYTAYIRGTDGNPDVYQIKSMDPPSPYIMFWPNSRPTFCLGLTLNDLSKKDQVIKISSKTFDQLKKVISVYSNPLLLVGETEGQEQVQLMKLEPSKITVSRGVNYNELKIHKQGSRIKVFPYENLTTSFLKENRFEECSVIK